MSKTFNMVGGGGINVVANPALTGTELELKGLEVNGAKYKVPLICPNLLDNAYFVGGGSQQGGGQFPINQKGQTSYSKGGGYKIDRWRDSGANIVTLESGGIKILCDQSSGRSFRQYYENLSDLSGKTVTYSALFSSVSTGAEANIRLIGSSDAVIASAPIEPGLVSITTTLPSDFRFPDISILTPLGAYVVVSAVKLEIGDSQTLAHNEGTEANPVWVLNEIPNYTEELWKCQRYYQIFASSSYRRTKAKDFRPVMRADPSTGTISINGTTYYYADANL